jgi:serine/threonine protein kinase
MLQGAVLYARGIPLIPSALLTMGDELLGRGGFGEVLSGSLNEGEAVRPVALKRLNLSRADAQMFGSALLDEVGIMMSLDHACVLRCLGAVLDPAALDSAHRPLGCCIVTERCLGSLRGSLDQLGGEREPKTGADLAASLLASWTNSLKVKIPSRHSCIVSSFCNWYMFLMSS